MMIETEKLNECFKDIQKECLENGEIVPYLLDNVPSDCRLTQKEVNKLKVTEENIKSIREKQKQRRKTELEISQNKNKKYKDIIDYLTDETRQFIDKYPQFKDIITEQ